MARPIRLHRTISRQDRELFIHYLRESHENLAQIHKTLIKSHGVKDYDVLQIATALRKLQQFQVVILAIPENKQ